jgi:hypothetical protein
LAHPCAKIAARRGSYKLNEAPQEACRSGDSPRFFFAYNAPAMKVSDFNYDLPAELIAQQPLADRTASRLLCLSRETGEYHDAHFTDLPDLLREGDLLVFNDTRVIPARLFARKQTGGRVEILVERLVGDSEALVQLRASKPPRPVRRRVCTSPAMDRTSRDCNGWRAGCTWPTPSIFSGFCRMRKRSTCSGAATCCSIQAPRKVGG